MKREFSAGGVVFKTAQGRMYIVLGQHAAHKGWVFPKGLIGDHIEGEGKEETAIREVKEETGVDAKIIEPLHPVTYWYSWHTEKREKTVYYYVMEAVGEDIAEHDWEMQDVQWIAAEDIAKKLTYPSDKTVWKEAKEKIAKLLDG